eukprot:g4293.t1
MSEMYHELRGGGSMRQRKGSRSRMYFDKSYKDHKTSSQSSSSSEEDNEGFKDHKEGTPLLVLHRDEKTTKRQTKPSHLALVTMTIGCLLLLILFVFLFILLWDMGKDVNLTALDLERPNYNDTPITSTKANILYVTNPLAGDTDVIIQSLATKNNSSIPFIMHNSKVLGHIRIERIRIYLSRINSMQLPNEGVECDPSLFHWKTKPNNRTLPQLLYPSTPTIFELLGIRQSKILRLSPKATFLLKAPCQKQQLIPPRILL